MFGLRTDLSAFYSLAARDNRLAPLSQRFRGLKPPCFPSVFEGLVNAIACQQLSLTAGIWVLNRLAEKCGPPFNVMVRYSLGSRADILRLNPDSLPALGFSFTKAPFSAGTRTNGQGGAVGPRGAEQDQR
jgi:DNA-3-methyladenine glycosylase II